MRDLMYVADTEAQWQDFAIAQGIASMMPSPPDGVLKFAYNPGYHGDHIGPVVIDPGEIDMTQIPPVTIRPPTLDERFHVNLRVIGESVEQEDEIGQRIFQPTEGSGVVWVNPVEVSTPARIWLGGMTYFDPAGKLARPGSKRIGGRNV